VSPFPAIELYAGTSSETENMGGTFFIPWARVGKARAEAEDEEVAKKLWSWLETECKGQY
jgi:retinol dehydrogenase 12